MYYVLNKKIPKIIVIIFLLIYARLVNCQNNWIWQNPIPQGANLYLISKISSERIIITGLGGTILLTHDLGQNWTTQRLKNISRVRAFSFVNENIGWAIGSWLDISKFTENNYESYYVEKIFKTDDGGLKWEEILIELSVDYDVYSINDIEFINESIGFILLNPTKVWPYTDQDLYPGLIFKTIDGGNSWIKIDINIDDKYSQLVFLNNKVGFLVTTQYYQGTGFYNNSLYRTKDSGLTWTKFEGNNFSETYFCDEKVGWSGSSLTTDSGKTWINKNIDYSIFDSTQISHSFIDSLNGFAVYKNNVYQTNNAGKTWQIIFISDEGELQDIYFNQESGFACGNGGTIYQTNNNGLTWERKGSGNTNILNDVEILDEETVYVVGNNGILLQTMSGGINWIENGQEKELDEIDISTVDFVNEQIGYIAGEQYFGKTVDGGNNWDINYIDKQHEIKINDIKFLTNEIGFAICQDAATNLNGFIYKTTDGGNTWFKNTLGNLPKLTCIYFVDQEYGWICGKNIILRTKDGGVNWSIIQIAGNLQHVQFVDRENGWASSIDDGSFYKTTDGGESWYNIPFESRFLQGVYNFYFFDKNKGFLTTGPLSCYILSTVDGGITWNYEEYLSTYQINGIDYLGEKVGYLVGNNGTILNMKGSYFEPTEIQLEKSNKKENEIIIYPNPFNNCTNIKYSLNKPQKVSIRIFDINGRIIEQYIVKNAKIGENIFNWRPSKISSGLYIIKIEGKDLHDYIKCLYLK